MIIVNEFSPDAFGDWVKRRITRCVRHIWSIEARGDGYWRCTKCPARARIR